MFFIRLLSRLPLWVLYGLSNVLYFLAYYVVGYRKKMVRKNLTNSFPDKSEQELMTIEKQFYRSLSDSFVEIFKLLTMQEDDLNKRMVYVNPEVVNALTDKGQSVLILASHQFNWEWLLACGPRQLNLPFDFVYQKLSNQKVNQVSLDFRTRFGNYAIEREHVAKELFLRRHRLQGTAMLPDQFPGHSSDKRYKTQFLNQETFFFHGVDQIARFMKYPVIFSKTRKNKRGHYEVHFKLLFNEPYTDTSPDIAELYARELEKAIQEEPANWLWSHNRWKKRD